MTYFKSVRKNFRKKPQVLKLVTYLDKIFETATSKQLDEIRKELNAANSDFTYTNNIGKGAICAIISTLKRVNNEKYATEKVGYNDPNRHVITDHCMARYMERVLGIDVDSFKNIIKNDMDENLSHKVKVISGRYVTIL